MNKSILFSLCLLIGLSGCRHDESIKLVAKKREVSPEVASLRLSVQKLNPTVYGAVCKHDLDLGLNLLRDVAQKRSGENVVIAPLGISQDLAMVHESAGGKTKEILAKFLGVQSLPKYSLSGYHSHFLNILDKDPYEILKMANGIWVAESYKVDQTEAKKLHNLFGCEVKSLPSDLGQAKKEMSEWIKQNTNGMIDELSTELSKETFVLFLNALYFNGAWKEPFDKDATFQGEFKAPSGTKKVSMMFGKERDFKFANTKDGNIASMDFFGNDYRYVVYVPSDGKSLQDALKDLSGKKLFSLLCEAMPSKGSVQMPKFKVTTLVDLKTSLTRLGAGALFTDNLNLSSLLPQADGKPGRFIRSALQKTVFELDEAGVKAASSTEIDVAKGDFMAEKIVVDEPFIFFVFCGSQVILCGIVNDPSKN